MPRNEDGQVTCWRCSVVIDYEIDPEICFQPCCIMLYEWMTRQSAGVDEDEVVYL